MTIPSPGLPVLTARLLLRRIRQEGGRVFRMPDTLVFCLTNDPKLAQWLIDIGGKAYLPAGSEPGMAAGYKRASDGKLEWDIYIHTIAVDGELTIWEAAAGRANEWTFDDPETPEEDAA